MKFALFGLALAFSVSAAATCIVSGDTSRDAAASEVSVLGGDWFDSSSFFIVAMPLQSLFDSHPPGFIFSFR